MLADIEAAGVFAPRHQPAALAGIKLTGEAFPGVPQVACFDTAFHHDLPLVAQTLPVPSGEGVRRYGFHGLSYEWAVSTLGSQLGEPHRLLAQGQRPRQPHRPDHPPAD